MRRSPHAGGGFLRTPVSRATRERSDYMTSSVLRAAWGVKTSFGGRVGCSTFVSMNMETDVPPPQPKDGIATAATATRTRRPAIVFFIYSHADRRGALGVRAMRQAVPLEAA